MTKLVLPGGTDVAEMALFSLDGLPDGRAPKPEEVKALEAEHRLLRFEMRADGGYLLHLFLDEPVPGELMQYADTESVKRGTLQLPSGRLAFGGLESTFDGFEPNDAIRSDGAIAAGEYDVTAYRMEYPEHLVRSAIEATLDQRARKHLAAPVKLTVTALIAAGIAALFEAWFVAALIALATAGVLRMFFKHPETRRLQAMKDAIQLRYPTILAVLRPRA